MKQILISLIISVAFVAGVVFFAENSGTNKTDQVEKGTANNVSMIDGKQVIEISAKGGYSPRKSIAKADVPTVIRMKTSGTFDCSSSVVIPSLDIGTSLQPTGSTDIPIPAQKAGTTLQGLCGMGMYSFTVDFN